VDHLLGHQVGSPVSSLHGRVRCGEYVVHNRTPHLEFRTDLLDSRQRDQLLNGEISYGAAVIHESAQGHRAVVQGTTATNIQCNKSGSE